MPKLWYAADCGEELFCEELDAATLISAYNEYRRKHKMLFPEEIKKIREQYGLSQRSFAKLLNWGDKTICRYENGAVQDRAHNSLLLFLREPANMRTYLTENEVMLDEKQKKQLLSIIENLEKGSEFQTEKRFYDAIFSRIPCEENGLSMSGLKYAHFPYGPVPEHFDMLLERMASDHIAHIEIFYDSGYEKHQVLPECELQEGSLSEEELQVLNRIYDKFKDYGSGEISEYSHKEKGYKSTKQGEIISYAFAKDIEL